MHAVLYFLTVDQMTDHKISFFDELKEEITSYFNVLLNSASDRLTEICKLDKLAWASLDDEEEQCKQKIDMIERVRDEQVLVNDCLLGMSKYW